MNAACAVPSNAAETHQRPTPKSDAPFDTIMSYLGASPHDAQWLANAMMFSFDETIRGDLGAPAWSAPKSDELDEVIDVLATTLTIRR
jgi:hypothetical protein